jgi:hypothetical protein
MPPRAPRRRRTGGRGPARCPKYLAWIRTLPCASCGSTWSVEAAHTGSDGGMRLKASDYSCAPICTECHTMAADSYHRLGREEFERRHELDLAGLVKELNHAWFAHAAGVK